MKYTNGYMTFESANQARDFLQQFVDAGLLDQLDNRTYTQGGTYVLSHGEIDRPDYVIQKYKDGFKIKRKFYYQRNTYGRLADGPVNLHMHGNPDIERVRLDVGRDEFDLYA